MLNLFYHKGYHLYRIFDNILTSLLLCFLCSAPVLSGVSSIMLHNNTSLSACVYCSNNSLFAVPANQEFVFVCPESGGHGGTNDLVQHYLEELRNNCNTVREGGQTHCSVFFTHTKKNQV